jgi:hypothetical protein
MTTAKMATPASDQRMAGSTSTPPEAAVLAAPWPSSANAAETVAMARKAGTMVRKVTRVFIGDECSSRDGVGYYTRRRAKKGPVDVWSGHDIQRDPVNV